MRHGKNVIEALEPKGQSSDLFEKEVEEDSALEKAME